MIKITETKNISACHGDITKLLENFGIKKIQEVYIKPNLGGRDPVIPGENTSVEFMLSLCSALKELDVKRILIGHSGLLNFGRDKCTFEDIVVASKYEQLKQIEGVQLIDLGKEERYEQNIEEIVFKIPKFIHDIFYINVAVLKTHMETSVSLALKNQMGLISPKNRMDFHKFGLHRYIARLGALIKPNVSLIDGTIAMQGNGPHHGESIKCDIVLSGNDMVELDCIAATIMGFEYAGIKHISLAHEFGAGKFPDAESLNLALKNKFLFKHPDTKQVVGRTFTVWPTTACSGCIFSLNRAKRMVAETKNPKLLWEFLKMAYLRRTNILMGTVEDFDFEEMAQKENLFVIGDCAQYFVDKKNPEKFLPGCPPKPDEVLKFLTEKRER